MSETAEWVAVVLSALSLILAGANAFWSYNLSKRQQKIDDEQLKIAYGHIELEMSAQLSAAKKYVDSWEILIYPLLNEDEKRTAINLKKDFAIEEMLNAYESVCQKFLDGKTDKDRFEKSYRNEITNLFIKSRPFKEKLDGDSSPFKAIKKVYNMWNNRE